MGKLLGTLIAALVGAIVLAWIDAGFDATVPKVRAVAAEFPGSARAVVAWCSRFDYDVARDALVFKGWLAALGGYAMASLLCTALDVLPGCFARWRRQQRKAAFTVGEWGSAVGLSLLNLGLVGWAGSLPNWWLFQRLHTPQRETDPWQWQWEASGMPPIPVPLRHLTPPQLPKLVGCVLVVDVWFYSTHRLLHHPALYARIHKLHHRFTAPAAVASMCAASASRVATCPTPDDWAPHQVRAPARISVWQPAGRYPRAGAAKCASIVTVSPPAPEVDRGELTAAGRSFFWLAFSLASTGCSHSGYLALGCSEHDIHHETFRYNYGVGGFMDEALGTAYKGDRVKAA